MLPTFAYRNIPVDDASEAGEDMVTSAEMCDRFRAKDVLRAPGDVDDDDVGLIVCI